MRVPHTLPASAVRAFQGCAGTVQEAARPADEQQRRLRADSTQWDSHLAPGLATLVLTEVAALPAEEALSFLRTLEETFGEDDHRCLAGLLLELLPPDLPLGRALAALPDGAYWERRTGHQWPEGNYPQHHGGSWKRLVAERTVQELLEQLDPESFDEDELKEQLRDASPEVVRLRLRELRRAVPFVLPDHPADTYNPEPDNSDHLDFGVVLKQLPGLQELQVVFTKLNMGQDFDPAEQEISIQDCQRLGEAVAEHETIATLRVRRSLLDALRTAALLRPLVQRQPQRQGGQGHPVQLAELDLSHCQLGDQGALAVAAALAALPSLATLILVNNKIGATGARGLAYAMAEASFLGERLDLRLNPIGDLGGQYVAALLRRNLGPRVLVLAGAAMQHMAGLHLAEALHSNCRLQVLDVSANPGMGEHVGRAVADAMGTNTWLLQLDMRDTGALDEHQQAVTDAVAANRERHRLAWEQLHMQEALQDDLQDAPSPEPSDVVLVTAGPSRDLFNGGSTVAFHRGRVALGGVLAGGGTDSGVTDSGDGGDADSGLEPMSTSAATLLRSDAAEGEEEG